MILTTRGIVLRAFRHSDSSMVAKVYTEDFGLQGFLVNVGTGAKSKSKANLLQPLSCLEMVVYHRDNHSLQRVKEINQHYVFEQIPFDIIKSSLALFVAEIIYRSIKEEEKNVGLFNFFLDEIKGLDALENTSEVNNFHLKFMVNFSKFLGFFPGNKHFETSVFDLSEGMFMHKNQINEYRLEEELSYCLYKVIESTEALPHTPLKISNTERKKLLRALIDYYNFHLPGMGEMKSQDVLETVLSG